MEAEKYLQTAKEVMNFINTRKKQGKEGIYWSLEDAAFGRPIYYDEICMYAGASGILCFLLSLYDVTKDSAYLDEAKEAAKYINYRWHNDRELKRNFSKYAFSSGWSGAGFAMTQLYNVTKDDFYKELVANIVNQAIKEAVPSEDGTGFYWSSYPGIVGNAGTVLFILYAAKIFENKEWKEFAIKAGRIFLNKGRNMGEGKKVYAGVDPTYFGAGDNYVDPNFPMGTGGIGFALLRLYEESKDEEFLDAVKGVPEYMSSVAVKIKYGKLLPHALPDRPNLFYLGYCHGPAGTTRFYYKLKEITKDSKYNESIKTLVSGLEDTGAPEIRTDGYWNTYNMCCGTAGLLNMYLGLWADNGSEKYLEGARRCGKVILDGVEKETVDGKTCAKWKFALDRVSPDNLSTPIGCFDGAAGIGAALIQLYLAEKNQFHTTRFIDDPFPSAKK